MLEKDTPELLKLTLNKLEAAFADLPSAGATDVNRRDLERLLLEVAERLGDNYPYFHPLYAGQMLKPPHIAARAAYALATWINPNNHALDGGRASSRMEKEAVAEIASMFGWKTFLGHLTGGGTVANLEALWVAGQLRPEDVIVASEQAHYTHQRISSVLQLHFEPIRCDSRGCMDVEALESRLRKGEVGTVVATMGTTGTGSVDPLPALLQLRDQYEFRLHADAAYGGYFVLVDNLPKDVRAAFDRLAEVDSIVIDPHKHGLQPYGCGCILFKDPSVGRFYKHQSPYTYFTSSDLHLGEISLECSRPGAAAVALWATQRLLPLMRGGEFAKGLTNCRSAAVALHRLLNEDRNFIATLEPDLDIVVWAARGESVSVASKRAQTIFDGAASRDLHLALVQLPVRFFDVGEMEPDRETLTCLRSVLMKPEHFSWIDRIWTILQSVTRETMRTS